MKLRAARKTSSTALGAVLRLILSQTRHTRYEEELAAIAGNSHISRDKIIPLLRA